MTNSFSGSFQKTIRLSSSSNNRARAFSICELSISLTTDDTDKNVSSSFLLGEIQSAKKFLIHLKRH